MSTKKQFYIRTPLVESRPLSEKSGVKVLMKLENTQPSDSFKLRGVSYHAIKKVEEGCTRLVASSGGNAGLATAYVGKRLNVPVTIYTPETTDQKMRDRLKQEGADVIVHGKHWDIAHAKALEDIEKDPKCAYVHPYDHPNVWEGVSSMIQEVYEDTEGVAPDLIVLCVGGGGLLCGVAHGLNKVGWSDTQILAMETIGADSFNQAVKAGKIVVLPKITSIAKTLGAAKVAEKALELTKTRTIVSETITDLQCVNACLEFADDHRFLVEPSCGASVTPFYIGLIEKLVSEGKLKPVKTALLIVCGGHCVTYQMLLDWKKQLESAEQA